MVQHSFCVGFYWHSFMLISYWSWIGTSKVVDISLLERHLCNPLVRLKTFPTTKNKKTSWPLSIGFNDHKVLQTKSARNLKFNHPKVVSKIAWFFGTTRRVWELWNIQNESYQPVIFSELRLPTPSWCLNGQLHWSLCLNPVDQAPQTSTSCLAA